MVVEGSGCCLYLKKEGGRGGWSGVLDGVKRYGGVGYRKTGGERGREEDEASGGHHLSSPLY